MPLRLNIIFVCEGNSDSALQQHLKELCVRSGADEVTSVSPDLNLLPYKIGNTVKEKVSAALRLEPYCDIIFIHRDSDSIDPDPRYTEIHEGVVQAGTSKEYVAVVPVQETEAWLLIDEPAIRVVAENPGGRKNLELPSIRRIESTANPKEVLKRAISRASGASGKRLRKIKKNFSRNRRQLIERIDIDGDIYQLSSWGRLVDDVNSVVST